MNEAQQTVAIGIARLYHSIGDLTSRIPRALLPFGDTAHSVHFWGHVTRFHGNRRLPVYRRVFEL